MSSENNLEVNLESSGKENPLFTINEDDDVIELIGDEIKDTVTGAQAGTSTGKRKRRLTSPVWHFYERLAEKTIDGKSRCKCKKCGAIFISDSQYGTGNLKRHSEKCVRKDTRDVGQLLMNHDISLRNATFDPERFRELLIAAMIMHDLPLAFVEYAGIRSVFSYLRESVSVISRNTARADVLKVYKKEKSRIKCLLEEASGRICLTSDLWTSIATDGYLSLTAHFIDKNWILQKRILNFSLMPPPHTGVALCNKITSLLAEWGIEGRLFSITLDNASANDTFVGLLRSHLNLNYALLAKGEFFHQRCCAHIINLIVQDGLKEIDVAVDKVRESVKYVKGSQIRKEKFLECVRLMSLNPKKGLRQDVPTRWNSTFLMLESAFYYRRAFCHLELSDSNYTNCPTSLEWQKIEKIKKFLGVFFEITNLFSGSKYPTANLYFPSIFKAYVMLKEYSDGTDEDLRAMSLRMLMKFEKYWSEFSVILSIAVILDPRYKLEFVDWSYRKLYGSQSSEFQTVRDKLFSLYEEYTTHQKVNRTSALQEKVASNLDQESESVDMLEEFDDYADNVYSASSKKSELEKYLDETRSDRKTDLDILEYWKLNSQRYPTVARMTRDILSIPVSTVASEAAFSCGGRVLDQYRSSLKPDLVEALMCSRDWLYGLTDSCGISMDQITEDVMNLNISEEPSTQGSNTVVN
ncbi:zinc finger BED domain-containing protein RICESLEEPER 2-like isoform X1 [Punica granatum]|uniref:Zinc finger BED domain-containing protein RICESLEEPER 2-like isoform X1 n=1 Tax=Punica granatum TaxID=22663 RepID=A0A6P8BMN6_PUNGR|nr:zinc finger BED domain-containing protein RICESLEEPER 2-like isoform X1 [Punica granatum]